MLVDWGVSIRRACEALKFDTSTYHYKSRRTGQAALERRIKEICETRVRYGYRRVHVLLRRESLRRDDGDRREGLRLHRGEQARGALSKTDVECLAME